MHTADRLQLGRDFPDIQLYKLHDAANAVALLSDNRRVAAIGARTWLT
jgi:hypothetical protein